jgi:hypothetical protein
MTTFIQQEFTLLEHAVRRQILAKESRRAAANNGPYQSGMSAISVTR